MRALITTIFSVLILHVGEGISQQLYCEYDVIREEKIVVNGAVIKTIYLDYKGVNYFKNSKVLSFLQPLYLEKHIDGKVSFNGTPEQGTVSVNFNTKPQQLLSLVDFDSLYYKMQADVSAGPDNVNQECDGQLYYFKFSRGFQPWIMLNETKTIQGLHCQRAKLYDQSNELMWDVWFTNDIPIQGSTQALFDLPGLMVEGHQPQAHYTYQLKSYTTTVDIPDSLFYPTCFNGTFRIMPTLKPYRTTKTDE